MSLQFSIARMCCIALFVALLAPGSHAIIWINEDFEDGIAFDHAPGTATGGAVDYYFEGGTDVVTTTSVAVTGTVSTHRALSGSRSLRLGAGEGFAVDHGVESPESGPVQIFQMAVSLDQVPAAAGEKFAEWRVPWSRADDPGTPADETLNYTFYMKFISDGANGVLVIAGQEGDNPTPATGIGRTTANEVKWIMLTFVYNRSGAPQEDPHLGTIPPGAHFYGSSVSSGLSFATEPGGGTGWPSFEVHDGVVYVDDVYWEGGLNLDHEPSLAARNLKAVDVPVLLNHFDLE